MKHAALLTLLISWFECDMAAEEPSVYVQISWDMTWRRFCSFADFFAEKLSGELYETKVLTPYVVKPVRIRFMNYESHCKDKGSNEDAVLDLFVSKSEKDLGPGDVDRNITILAYTKLHDYWRNKKMALLDPIFLGKVNKVELMGRDKPDIPEGVTESRRVAIGIVVALIFVLLITSICMCVNLRRKIKKPLHGVAVNGVPLHVIHTEPSEPTIKTDEPPAYDLDQRDGHESQASGFDRQDAFDRREENYNGYPVRNKAYDEESLGSPML